MATTGSQLGQARPANTSAVSIYSPAASTETRLKQLIIANTGTVAATYRVFIDDDGTTYDATTAIAWDAPIAVGSEPQIIDLDQYMNDSTGNIAVRASVADTVTFTLSGLEKTV